MEKNTPDYRISTPNVVPGQEGSEDKTYWNNLGVGFNGKDGKISVRLNAHPIGDTIVLFPWTDKDSQSSDQPSA